MMTITNRQELADLMYDMDAANATSIQLPDPDGRKNSAGSTGIYDDTWQNELFDLRKSDPAHTICIDGDGVYLYGYRFVLDGTYVCFISLEYETVEPRGCVLVDDWGIDTPADLVDAWLGDTMLSEHIGEDIVHLATLAGIDTSNLTGD